MSLHSNVYHISLSVGKETDIIDRTGVPTNPPMAPAVPLTPIFTYKGRSLPGK